MSADNQEAALLVGDRYRLQRETDSELHVGGSDRNALGRVLRRRLGELGLRRAPLVGCPAERSERVLPSWTIPADRPLLLTEQALP